METDHFRVCLYFENPEHAFVALTWDAPNRCPKLDSVVIATLARATAVAEGGAEHHVPRSPA